MLSIPIGAFIRLVPNSIFGVSSDETDLENTGLRQWNSPSKHVRDELSLVKSLRGGRLRTVRRSQHNQVFAAAVFPSLVATVVGGGNATENALPSDMNESMFFQFLDEHQSPKEQIQS
ncbi:plasma membrane calcium [Basidiobolus ranarum]|uniref:Plasma membrane calcium n=1 Tax=Basidiobolus ranarum TaxID=34480 RepID=A0ABR2VJH0_9FUNG